MARTYGLAPIGQRVSDRVPRNRGQVTTVLGAIRVNGEPVFCTIDAATSRDVFLAFVEQVLLPELRPGDSVVLDNLGAHRGDQVRDLLATVGAYPHYLPPYSPDFNPIELFWAWMKDRMRSQRPRTAEAVDDSVADAASNLSPDAVFNCARHCGYWGQLT